MQNLYGAETILHSKSLCYSTPPERGHLSRTGHIGGYYMLVYTVVEGDLGGHVGWALGSDLLQIQTITA
jgi:hypothetical protein